MFLLWRKEHAAAYRLVDWDRRWLAVGSGLDDLRALAESVTVRDETASRLDVGVACSAAEAVSAAHYAAGVQHGPGAVRGLGRRALPRGPPVSDDRGRVQRTEGSPVVRLRRAGRHVPAINRWARY